MWNKIKTIIITVLATLGVLFIILMLIPDDEDETAAPVTQTVQEVQESPEETETQETSQTQEVSQPQEDTEESATEYQNAATASVNIPESEISGKTVKFTTKTLDGKKVDQSIFSDHDITIVHVWGTYCGPCISEMGSYGRFYENMPSNVNLIGIVCDVYDGMDNNADSAKEILDDAGAGFTNLRLSDSVYDVVSDIQVIPSSFFVDREGHIIGDMMMGAHYDAVISRLNGYLK